MLSYGSEVIVIPCCCENNGDIAETSKYMVDVTYTFSLPVGKELELGETE